MAEEFQAGACSGNWWNSTRSPTGFDGSTVSASMSSVACSETINDIGSFGWTEEKSKVRSCDESVASGSSSSVSFHDAQKVQVSDSLAGGGRFLIGSSLPTIAGFSLSSPTTVDWHQNLLSSGRAESSSFHCMLQEDDLSRRAYPQQQETAMLEPSQVQTPIENSSMNPFQDMNQAFLLHQHQLNSGNFSGNSSSTGFPIVSVGSYDYSSTLSQGVFEQYLKPDQHSSIDNQSVNYPSPMTYRLNSTEFSQPSWPKFPQLLKVSSPKQHPNPLHFSNANPFLNSSAASINLQRPGVYLMPHTQFLTQKLEEKPNCSNITLKSIPEEIPRNSNSGTKKSGNEPAFKKPRNEMPSPIQTFKVRKEKLGDRITALQQLVSPFGKTDRASVLHEAIDYIKFLHEQVLTTPYFKNGAPMQHHRNSDRSKDSEGLKQDLRSRGLCLVPISSTYQVANEPTADFWTPAFGGTFR